MTATVNLATGARWSLAARCARMACLHLDGETPAPEDPEMLGYQLRGHVWEHHVARQLEDEYGEAPHREYPVDWPHGTIHADFYLAGPNLIVEHKSRTSTDALDSDWLQLAGQCYYHPARPEGQLRITHPVTGYQRVLPFTLTGEWAARVEHVTGLISRRQEFLPGRVCRQPSEARSRFCRFAAACFDDWQPPETLLLPTSLEPAVAELARVEQELKDSTGRRDELTGRRDQLRAELAPHLLNGADYQAAGVRVRRTVSADSVTYDMKAALAAGAVTEETILPFAKPRKGAERWTVTVHDPGLLAQADEPPF